MTRLHAATGLALATAAGLTGLSFGGSIFYPADLISHFRLHLAGASLLLTLLLLLAGKRDMALLAGGLVAFNLLTVSPIRTVPATPAEAGDVEFTIATFNIWARNGDLPVAARMLQATGADVVLLQEVSPAAEPLLDALKSTYPWRHDCTQVPYCDLAMLSRHPWVEIGTSRPSRNQPSLLWARFERGGRSVTVATTHLNRPPRPVHLRQIDGLSGALAGIRGPIVLGGDFNAAPWSYAITRLIEASGLAPLAGIRPTWPAIFSLPPQLPIDHLLVSGGIRNLGVERGPFAGSDHLPVIARLGIGREAGTMRR